MRPKNMSIRYYSNSYTLVQPIWRHIYICLQSFSCYIKRPNVVFYAANTSKSPPLLLFWRRSIFISQRFIVSNTYKMMPQNRLHFCNVTHLAMMYFKLRFHIPVCEYCKNRKVCKQTRALPCIRMRPTISCTGQWCFLCLLDFLIA